MKTCPIRKEPCNGLSCEFFLDAYAACGIQLLILSLAPHEIIPDIDGGTIDCDTIKNKVLNKG